MDIIQEYFDLQEKVHEYFGYVEDWKVIPLVDHRDMFWILSEHKNEDDETYGADIYYYEKPIEDGYEDDGEHHYHATLYTQRFLPKWIYRAEAYTMICMDTHTDGNQFIGIFDNTKEQTGVEPYNDSEI